MAWTYPASLLYNHFQLETSLGIGIFLVYSTRSWRTCRNVHMYYVVYSV